MPLPSDFRLDEFLSFDSRLLELSAPLKDLARCNELVSGEDRNNLNNDIALLFSHLSLLQSMADLVTEQKRRVGTAIAYRSSVLAPVRTLPSEILAHIFVLGTTGPQHPLDPTSFPLVVSKVCSRWRGVAVSIPALWTTIHVDFFKIHGDFWNYDSSRFGIVGRMISESLKVWTARARDSGIDLTVDTEELPDDPTAVDIIGEMYTDTVFAFSGKWRKMRLASWAFQQLTYYQVPAFPNLEFFKASCDGTIARKFSIEARKLSTLILEDDQGLIRQLYSANAFPWGQLTSLAIDIHKSTFRAILPILSSACETLEELTYTSCEELAAQGQTKGTPIDVRFPRLNRVHVGSCIGKELDRFTMPALRSLRLHPVWAIYWDSVIDLLRRSQCRVKDVTLAGEGPGDFQRRVCDFLRAVPDTTEFSCYRSDPLGTALITEELRMDGDTSGSPLLPCMTHFGLAGNLHDFNVDSAISMITSRMGPNLQGCTSLSSVMIGGVPRTRWRQMSDAIASWRVKGLVVHSKQFPL